jgi:glyoxylase-like metal-dependent hydrolase (beta-lactamase superfamily II)
VTIQHGAPALTRRAFLVRAGQGTVAVAILGVWACAPTSRATSASSGDPTPGPVASTSVDGTPTDGFRWDRVDVGIVSAYVLARGGEAAIVDTGVGGSEDDIAAGLERLGLDWSAVGHLIITHQHGDHAGSAAAVLDAAPDATGYAGAADIPAISVPRPLTAVDDGDRVFDLAIVATPGHTAGHIAALDEASGVLVAGDALNTADGQVTGPNPQFSADMDTALASVAKLGELSFETVLVGHGDPVTSGASAQVAALAAGG